MKVIIAGLGKTGLALVRALKEDGQEVSVIDTSRQLVEQAERDYSVNGVIGNAATVETLTDANVKRAGLFIAALNSDELSMLSCLSAKKCGAAHTVAVSKNPEFLTELPYFSTLCGIDMIFNPEFETANDIFRTINIPGALTVLGFAGGRAELANVKVSDSSEIIGKTLAEIRLSSKLSVLVCAVKRGGKVIIPDGRFEIEKDDSIYITGPHSDLYAFLNLIGIPNNKVKNVLIIGADNTALYLASALEKSGISVTVAEKSEKRCSLLQNNLKRTKVICCDPIDGAVITHEDFSGADVVAVLSDNEEENLIAAVYAQKSGAQKIITKLSKQPLYEMMPNLGDNSTLVSNDATLSRIAVTNARALASTIGSSVGTVYKIADGQAENIEFIAMPEFLYIGVPLMKLNIKSGILIAGIIRGKEVLYPNGITSIEEGDRVIIVSSGRHPRKLKDIMAD